MNKQERKLKGKAKFKKRLANHKISTDSMMSINSKANLHAFKTTGKPCSCVMCSPAKTGEERSQDIKRKKSCDASSQMVEYINRHEDFWEDCLKYRFWDDEPFW